MSDTLDEILKDYIAKHADGFFGKGTPKDAIRIREEAKAKLQSLITGARIAELNWMSEMSTHHYNKDGEVTEYTIAGTHVAYRIKQLEEAKNE